jgi:hypothetical protein
MWKPGEIFATTAISNAWLRGTGWMETYACGWRTLAAGGMGLSCAATIAAKATTASDAKSPRTFSVRRPQLEAVTLD